MAEQTTIRDLVIQRITDQFFLDKADVLSLVGSREAGAWYAAVRLDDEVKGVVALVDFEELMPTRFMIVTEDMGPFAFTAPAEILDLLTPTDDDTSNAWREACRKVLNGEELPGAPYTSFSRKGDALPEGVASFVDEAERRAYRDGMLARMQGREMEDFDDPNMPAGLRQIWNEGWLNQAINSEVGEVLGMSGGRSWDPSDDAEGGDYVDLFADIYDVVDDAASSSDDDEADPKR